MANKLTDGKNGTIAKAEPPDSNQRFIFDDHQLAPRGFALRITKAGGKAFILKYQSPITFKQRRLTIGQWPTWSLTAGRERARQLMNQIDSGIDPLKVSEDKRKLVSAQAVTVELLFDRYIAKLDSEGKRTAKQVKQIYDHDIGPVIGGLGVSNIEPDHIKMVLLPIIERKKLTLANRCRSYLLSAFTFGIRWDNDAANFDASIRFNIKTNPVRDVPRPYKAEKPGNRFLTDNEVRQVWAKCNDPSLISANAGTVLRLILATGGQRVEEVLRAKWSEFNLNDNEWVLPPERTKKGRYHVVPLGSTALDVLKQIYQADSSEYLFPKRGKPDEPMRTDALGNAVRRFCIKSDIEKFTARDLRRTVKTLMGKLGISKEIRDRLQNHAMTDVSSKHYDRYDYMTEKRNVIASWDGYLQDTLASKQSDNVTRLGVMNGY